MIMGTILTELCVNSPFHENSKDHSLAETDGETLTDKPRQTILKYTLMSSKSILLKFNVKDLIVSIVFF